MAQTKSLILLILILILGNFFVGSLVYKSSKIILDDINPLANLENDLRYKSTVLEENQKDTGIISSISTIGSVGLLLPVTLLKSVIDLLIIIAIGFLNVPVIINVMFIAPLSFIVTLEYILPLIRGN